MNRGEIFLANLNPSRGSEQAGIRPVIVIQRNTIGRFTRTALVVPLSSALWVLGYFCLHWSILKEVLLSQK